ncbi:MAG: FAD-linked oxidase C-terminal domain-containing protein [Thermoproteota archaeon]
MASAVLKKHAETLTKILGPGKVVDDPAIVKLYSRDPVGHEGSDAVVVFPESIDDISAVVSYAYRNDVKLYPQGSTTGLARGSVPEEEGIVVSMARMNGVKEIGVVDGYAVAEAGVRIDDLNAELAEKGYMFPVDPASSAVATVGGAVNTGAGGLRGAKYGTMRDWVLGLKIVLPDEKGTQMFIGCRTVKCRQGYDLVRLIVGSEGTLAIVAEAVLRITPLPENVVTVLAFYENLSDLFNAVVEIRSSGVQPYIMEFMDSKTVAAAVEAVGAPFKAEGHMLLVSIDVNMEATDRVLKWLVDTVKGTGAKLVYYARSPGEAEEKQLFKVRKSLYPAQMKLVQASAGRPGSKVVVFIEDIAVPPSRLIDAVEGLRQLEEEYKLPTMIGGHVGDGNLHPATGFDVTDRDAGERVMQWHHDVMKLAVKLGGTVSAEHGIGILKKEGLRYELEANGAEKALDIMRAIKRAFDPKNILNPGRVV